jgi:hypothetical protein
MGDPATRPRPLDEPPPLDPTAIQRAYRLQRARRRFRLERKRARQAAVLRFWITLVVLLGAAVFLSLTIWKQVQQLFGL